MKRAIEPLAAVLALSLLAMPLGASAQAPNSVSGIARHVAIMDGATGLLLYCDECETPMPPASMSKLMTVLLVAEHLAAGDMTLETNYTVSERAWRQGAVSDGSHMFLELGSQASARDLLTGVITVSANDACIVLAEGISGSEEAFVLEMNRRAQALGLTSARFRNTTGLPDPEHVISSADLARLARHLISAYPELYRLYSQPSFTYNNRTQQNRNPLLGAFAGADGVKTGHTNASGYGLVGSAALEGSRRIIVFNGTRSMAERRSEAQRLMSAAFHDFAAQRLYETGAEVGAAEVWLGGRESVPLVAQSDIIVGGPRSVQAGLSARIIYDGPVHAPIEEGAVVARLVVEGSGFETREYPLAAGARVGRANVFARAWTGLILTLGGSQ
jgi:D-alanyl-D-alanine carboxypeptidase (penicillin-binding protein 5/6)